MEKSYGVGVKRIGNVIVFTIAILYFLLDALFATVAVPLSRWIGVHWAFARIHRWVLSLRPHQELDSSSAAGELSCLPVPSRPVRAALHR